MKFISTYWILLLILLLATFLRFYQLGINPPGLDWDEASQGYNAYSLLYTGKDEYGTFLPLSIRSFDDYKPPLLTYLMVPSVGLFGLNEFAVRLPSVLLGILAVWITYLLVQELFSDQEKYSQKKRTWVALTAAFFLAISPWHLQFSRTAFEANAGLTCFLAGFLFLLLGMKKQKRWLLSAFFFGLSLYSYHSFRLITPLFLLGFIALFSKVVKKNQKNAFFSLIVFLLFALPVGISFIAPAPGAAARLGMVTVFGANDTLQHSLQELQYDQAHTDLLGVFLHNRRFVYIGVVLQGYFSHFNPDFLFFNGDSGRQHHASDMGMLYLWELPFIFAGLIVLFLTRNKKLLLVVFLLLLAPLPSAIATDPPHAVRAIAMIPALHILTALGVVSLVVLLKKQRSGIWYLGSAIFGLLLCFNVFYYLHQYYVETPVFYADAWQYGYKQAFAYAKQHESEYQHVVVTYKYDQPYIYYLFFNQIDPTWNQQEWTNVTEKTYGRMNRTIGKYQFRPIDWEQDSKMQQTLFIGSPSEIPDSARIIHIVQFPSGVTAFRFAATP